MKKIWEILIVLLCLSLVLTACTPSEPAEVQEEETETVSEYLPSIALALNGPINDMDWCAGAYEGLMQIEEQYGAKVSFAESIPQSDMEEVIHSYADAGFDIVVGHSSQFMDSILAVAKDYPDTQFVCVNGTEVRDNVTNIEIAEDEAGYIMGAAAALITENNAVGAIGGVKIKPVQMSLEGFEKGAKYINPNIDAVTAYTGSWSDAIKAKETSYAMIENGTDVIANLIGFAGIAILEASEEKDIYAIGSGKDQHTLAPDNVPISVIKDLGRLYTFVYEEEMEARLEQKVYFLGTKEGAVYPLYPGDVNQEIKDKLDEITKSIANGELEVN
jgi:basic membrane protein A